MNQLDRKLFELYLSFDGPEAGPWNRSPRSLYLEYWTRNFIAQRQTTLFGISWVKSELTAKRRMRSALEKMVDGERADRFDFVTLEAVCGGYSSRVGAKPGGS